MTPRQYGIAVSIRDTRLSRQNRGESSLGPLRMQTATGRRRMVKNKDTVKIKLILVDLANTDPPDSIDLPGGAASSCAR